MTRRPLLTRQQLRRRARARAHAEAAAFALGGIAVAIIGEPRPLALAAGLAAGVTAAHIIHNRGAQK